MEDYERAVQTLSENPTNSEFSKRQAFDPRRTSTEFKRHSLHQSTHNTEVKAHHCNVI